MSGASTPHYNFNHGSIPPMHHHQSGNPIPLLQLGFTGRPPPPPPSAIRPHSHGFFTPGPPIHPRFAGFSPHPGPPPLQPLMPNGNGTRPRCAVCNDVFVVEQMSRLGCGHRLCSNCVLSSGASETCQICSAVPSLLANRHVRDAFNGQTSSFCSSNRSSQPMASSGNSSVDGSPSVQFGPLGSRDSTFSIWEPLPLGGPGSADGPPDMTKPPPAVPFFVKKGPPSEYGDVFNTLPVQQFAPSGSSTPTTMPSGHLDNQNEMMTVDIVGSKCTNCLESSSAVAARCLNCNEYLCGTCILAHARVKVTRNHKIIALVDSYKKPIDPPMPLHLMTSSEPPSLKTDSESPNSCAGGSTASLLSACPDHDLFFVANCATCGGATLCVRCLQSHVNHVIRPMVVFDAVPALRRLVNESMNIEKSYEDSMIAVHKTAERLDQALSWSVNQTRSAISMHVEALQKRQKELIAHIEEIYRMKSATLGEQGEMLKRKRGQLNDAIGRAMTLLNDVTMASGASSNSSSLNEDNDPRIAECYDALLRLHAESFVPLVPTTNDVLRLKLPANDTMLQAVRSIGQIESGMCPKTSMLLGTRFKRAIAGRPYAVNMQMKDVCGDIVNKECREQGGEFVATLFGPLHGGGASLQHAEIFDRENGTCALMFNPKHTGIYRLNVTYCQLPVTGAPTEITVCAGRDYRDAQSRGQKFCFGREGIGDGEFSRPWGICCDSKGRIIVADRSNHRIQIFDSRGQFIAKFGTKGFCVGQFNRPAGVCANSIDEIVVADKDNHRIQIFNRNGIPVRDFGTRGCKTGLFNYPWGVATNGADDIAVTDTRNHRVQIFTKLGHPLRVCLVDSGIKRFSGLPRGICYLPDGDLLVTDFNTHRLTVVNSAGETKFYGCEGQVPGSFHRPQGVAVDPDGLVLVCDSRSHRVQVLNLYDLSIVAIFGGDRILTEKPISNSIEAEKLLDTTLFRSTSSPIFYNVPNYVEEPDDQLDNPTDVCVSPEGLVYVVDFKHNCIRVY